MKALVYERVLARMATARLSAALRGSGHGADRGPLRLVEVEPPALPGPSWARIRPHLAGICGSDLATIDSNSSRYFEDLVSFPFVPGHEVVGTIEQAPASSAAASASASASARQSDAAGITLWQPGDRVVIEPVIGCTPRAIDPPCPACADGHNGSCQHVAYGHLAPGLQVGYCADTGGGWSGAGLVAHTSQLHRVPDTFSDEAAVMVEPTACAVHGALAGRIEPTDCVAVIGAGTLGLATVAAIRQLCNPTTLAVGAKYSHQRTLAGELGADLVVAPDQLHRTIRRITRSLPIAGRLTPGAGTAYSTGGADVVVDCVGSSASIQSALALVRPRGRIVLVGMPGQVGIDLAGLWHREICLVGAYAYGSETVDTRTRRTFDIAFDVVAAARLERLVSARYPLERYNEALVHAGAAGRRGAVKIVFDVQARATRPQSPPSNRPSPSASTTRHAAQPRAATAPLPSLRKGHVR